MPKTRTRGVDTEEALRAVKRERVTGDVEDSALGDDDSSRASHLDRRVLRSKYLVVMNLINEEREDVTRADSDEFSTITGEVERLHELVQKPREQVADAEALLGIANTLASSVKSHSNEGIPPAEFFNCFLNEYGQNPAGEFPPKRMLRLWHAGKILELLLHLVLARLMDVAPCEFYQYFLLLNK